MLCYCLLILIFLSKNLQVSARISFQQIEHLERPTPTYGSPKSPQYNQRVPLKGYQFPRSYHVHYPKQPVSTSKFVPTHPKLIYELKPRPEFVHFEWRPDKLELFCQKVPVIPVINTCPSYLDAANHVFATPCSDEVKSRLCHGSPKKCRLFIRLGIGSGNQRYCRWSISHLWSASNQTGSNAKFGGKYPMQTDLPTGQATDKDLSLCLALYHDTTQLPAQLMPMYETVVQQTRKLRLAPLNVKTLLNDHEDHFKKNEYIKYWLTTGPSLAADPADPEDQEDPEERDPDGLNELFCNHIYIKLGALFKVSTNY